MCLKINTLIHKKLYKKYIPIKIKENLEVYKWVKADWNENITRVWSPVYYFVYGINNEYCTKLGIVHKEVYEGFHSYLNKSFAIRNSLAYSLNCNTIATCIIPKGSKIFLSDNFIEIVSNKIRIIGIEKIC